MPSRMTTRYRRRRPPIDARTKWTVWNYTAHGRTCAVCAVCGCDVSMPEAIRRLTRLDPFRRVHPIAHFGHVLAWSQGGTHSPSNLVLLCPSCNLRMGTTHMRHFSSEHMDVDTSAGLIELMDTSDGAWDRLICRGACASRSWSSCRNAPLPGNMFCASHISQRMAL